ncbi:MAG: hypothetical protein WCG34_02545 [Leptolinea sp.]
MNRIIAGVVSSVFLLVSITGCTLPQQKADIPQASQTPIPISTPDVNATVNAAVAATTSAQNAVQSTISSSVSATVIAIPPKPTPTPINVDTVTEAEVAAMVDKAVEEAMTASTTCATTAASAAADSTVTAEEVQAMTDAVIASEEAIAEATALADQYLALYAEMGEETIVLLQQMEEDLSTMSTATTEIASILDEINGSIQQGIALADETITQLETQADQIQTQVAEIQGKADGWQEKVTSELENRADLAGNLQPDQLASDRQGSFQQVIQYADLIKTSLGDGKLSGGEFAGISMAGANASGSIRQFGGPGGDALANQINNVTRNLAKGDIPQARSGLSGLEKDFSGLVGAGGGLPSKPEINIPNPPKRK